MIVMMPLTMATDQNTIHTNTSMGTGTHMRPRVSGLLQDIDMDAYTWCMEATAALVAVHRASGAQVRINNIKDKTSGSYSSTILTIHIRTGIQQWHELSLKGLDKQMQIVSAPMVSVNFLLALCSQKE